ncbi:MAG: hypothetical protein SLAVMIC_00385 [uncultured marine phage]|uniref:Uncharacterized protein n=1 Tax=uncultured marine phage TaxID=707152 RepID=A0A8D9CE35_9VIRU|nr:MAG: hypothetical protein SLAVMIC_00385 [uncultured marine phage]
MDPHRTAIVLKNGKIISKNGTRDEMELFVLENMDNMKQSRTINKKTGKLDDELSQKM